MTRRQKLCGAGVLALIAIGCLIGGEPAQARCHFACTIRHPWASTHDTGYVCHTWRCRKDRYEKGHDQHQSSSSPSQHRQVHYGKWDHRCAKKWVYNGIRYWHWRYYLGRKYLRTGANRIGVGPSHPLCDVTGR